MILYKCQACGKYKDSKENGCSDNCAYLENWKLGGILLTIEETKSVVRELGATFIDRDNPLCNEVLDKMINFVQKHEQLDK